MEYLTREDIKHNLAIIKIKNSYKPSLSALELYDITRGCWKRRLESVQVAEYVLAVFSGIVKEVYKVNRWVPAYELNRETIPFDAEAEKGRIGFFGEVADSSVREWYIGKSVARFYKQGDIGPVKVLLKDDSNEDCEERIAAIERDLDDVVGDERDAVVKVRVNQDKFREGLLKKYNSRCCLCGVDNDNLLVASHIKPWAKSDEHEKLDLSNGLLLCPNHDKLFDAGFISFDADGKILISKRLSEPSRLFMNVHENMKIDLTGKNDNYLKYHRENIFE